MAAVIPSFLRWLWELSSKRVWIFPLWDLEKFIAYTKQHEKITSVFQKQGGNFNFEKMLNFLSFLFFFMFQYISSKKKVVVFEKSGSKSWVLEAFSTSQAKAACNTCLQNQHWLSQIEGRIAVCRDWLPWTKQIKKDCLNLLPAKQQLQGLFF